VVVAEGRERGGAVRVDDDFGSANLRRAKVDGCTILSVDLAVTLHLHSVHFYEYDESRCVSLAGPLASGALGVFRGKYEHYAGTDQCIRVCAKR